MLVDTHCHLGDRRFDDGRSVVVSRAVAAGVGHIVIIADSWPTTEQAVVLASELNLSASAGVHPHVASSWNAAIADSIEGVLVRDEVVAVGETGLDYHYDFSPRDQQRAVFAEHLSLASRYGLPAIVHSRKADEDTIRILENSDATVVLHSFCSGPALLDAGIRRRAYISFSGMVTFGSWQDFDAVRSVPSDRILIETDAPYLAPKPHRGKRNEPAYVLHVAEKIAEIRGEPLEQVERNTTANAIRCFGNRVGVRGGKRR